MPEAFTLARYKVLPGKADAFIEAWSDLADRFSRLPNPPIWGTLIRSVSDPNLFYSFGPWQDAAHVAEMRVNPDARAAFEVVRKLCVEMTPGDYEAIRHVRVRADDSPAS